MHPEENMSLLEFRRGVSLGLMTSSLNSNTCQKRLIRGESSSPRSSPRSGSPNCSRLGPAPTKRRKYNYSVSNDVRLSNRGSHWPIFTKIRRRCEQCSSMAIESRPHSKCLTCGVYLCCNERKNCFLDYHSMSEN